MQPETFKAAAGALRRADDLLARKMGWTVSHPERVSLRGALGLVMAEGSQAGEGEGSGANRPAIPLLSPAGAYSIASQWGSYVRAGDPGACFYSFKTNDARPVSEVHRQACLDWTDHCAERVKARSPYKPVDAVDLGALLALRAFFVAAELAP